MSDSVRAHRWQPTRLPRPWDSPGKNTGVDCHFLLQCMKVKSESEVTQPCLTLRYPMDCSPSGSSVHVIFPGKSTGVGCHCLLHIVCYIYQNKGTLVRFLGWNIHWRRNRLPTPIFLGFPCGSAGKESARSAGDLGSIPGLGRSPGERKGSSLQFSGLENSMECIVLLLLLLSCISRVRLCATP